MPGTMTAQAPGKPDGTFLETGVQGHQVLNKRMEGVIERLERLAGRLGVPVAPIPTVPVAEEPVGLVDRQAAANSRTADLYTIAETALDAIETAV